MNKKLKNNKGITLIALVITIIILLILAGVTISSLTENGLFEKAQLAKEKQAEAEVKEKISLLVSEYTIDKEQGKSLLGFLSEKKDNGEIDDFVDNGDGTFKIIIEGYETTINESDLSVTEPEISANEDTQAPTATIEITKTIIFNEGKIQANVTVKDNKSGVNINACKWVVVQNSENLGTDDESLYTVTFTGTTQTIETETITEAGEYYIHLLLKDNVGNVAEVISEKVEIKDGYEISTPEELQAISSDLDGSYYVTKDIDMTGIDFQIISGFVGTLDGQGHTISNFTTTTGGLFNITYGSETRASIKNILFKNVNITGSTSSPYDGTGIIAAGAADFEKVGITGTISNSSTRYVGSFIGQPFSTSTFKNCYARTTIAGAYGCLGGIVGYTQGTQELENCYYSGNASIIKATTVTSCYYNQELYTSNSSYGNYGTGLNTSDFANKDNFTGWDFTNDWYIDAETGYPELKF